MEIIGVAGGRFSLAGGSLKLVGVEAVVKRREKPSGASIENKPPLRLSLAPYHILGRLPVQQQQPAAEQGQARLGTLYL